MVIWALNNSRGGELFVPKIPSYRITDVAEAIGPNCKKRVVGIRPGEKIHEEMITQSDSFSTVNLGKYYAIFPADGRVHKLYEYENITYERVPADFSYNSGTNPDFLTVSEIREMIKTNIDHLFEPK